MPFFQIFVLTADVCSESREASNEEQIRQKSLLKLFFADLKPKGRASLSHRLPGDRENYFLWDGVYCLNGYVDHVHYEYMKTIGNFNIRALPHTTTSIKIFSSRQTYSVQTRMLPNRLKRFVMYENRLFGTIDLTSLPDTLQDFNANKNLINGPIDLRRLPQSLRRLDLSFNKIGQKILLYSNLPSELQAVDLTCQDLWTGGVEAVEPFNEEDSLNTETAARIFTRLKHYH